MYRSDIRNMEFTNLAKIPVHLVFDVFYESLGFCILVRSQGIISSFCNIGVGSILSNPRLQGCRGGLAIDLDIDVSKLAVNQFSGVKSDLVGFVVLGGA